MLSSLTAHVVASPVIVPMAGEIDLEGAFSTAWNGLKSGFGAGTLSTMLTTVGVILVLFAVGKFLWDRRRGSGGNTQAVWGALIVGSVLAAPEVLLPLLLKILDFIANSVVKIVQAIT